MRTTNTLIRLRDVPANLSLRWTHISEGTFYYVAVRLCPIIWQKYVHYHGFQTLNGNDSSLRLGEFFTVIQMSPNVRKYTFWHERRTKTQISLRIRADWSESSLSAWRNFASLAIQNAPSEDSDQSANGPADWILCLAHLSEDAFSDVTIQIITWLY